MLILTENLTSRPVIDASTNLYTIERLSTKSLIAQGVSTIYHKNNINKNELLCSFLKLGFRSLKNPVKSSLLSPWPLLSLPSSPYMFFPNMHSTICFLRELNFLKMTCESNYWAHFVWFSDYDLKRMDLKCMFFSNMHDLSYLFFDFKCKISFSVKKFLAFKVTS